MSVPLYWQQLETLNDVARSTLDGPTPRPLPRTGGFIRLETADGLPPSCWHTVLWEGAAVRSYCGRLRLDPAAAQGRFETQGLHHRPAPLCGTCAALMPPSDR